MSYDARKYIKTARPGVTLTGAVTLTAVGPKGKKGRLIDYGIEDISTTTAGASTTPVVEVGLTGTLAAYGTAFDVGALTAPAAKSVRSSYKESDATFATLMAQPDLPADTPILLTLVPASGGGAAGVGSPFMIIAWDD